MSMALKYKMKKRMAKGGHVKGVHEAAEGLDEPGTSDAGFENERANFRSGMAKSFGRGAYQSMANEHHDAAKDKHREKLHELKTMKRPHGEYAEGGDVKKETFYESKAGVARGQEASKDPKAHMKFGRGYDKDRDVKGVHTSKFTPKGGSEGGHSDAGVAAVRSREYYPKEGEKGYHRQYSPAQHLADSRRKHAQVLSEIKSGPRPHGEYAKGGSVGHDDDDLVMTIMKKRYASGGEVSDDTGDGQEVDKMENQFDYLVSHGDEQGDADYTGANSGDEVGNEALDEEDSDVVSQIMKSRKKKDRLPSPA